MAHYHKCFLIEPEDNEGDTIGEEGSLCTKCGPRTSLDRTNAQRIIEHMARHSISKTSNWTLATSTLERKLWSNSNSTFTLGLTTSTLKCDFHDFGIYLSLSDLSFTLGILTSNLKCDFHEFGIYLSLSDLSQAFRQIFVTISMTSVEM